jgi:hypothetical protein
VIGIIQEGMHRSGLLATAKTNEESGLGSYFVLL